MFSLPGRGFHQRVTLISSVPTTLDDVGDKPVQIQFKLSGNQNKILVKWFNYAVTPEKIPTEEFVVAAEQATWSLPQEQKNKLRADITGVLKSAKVPKQNITRQERTALKGLQKEKSITILPADKGKATVIKETREYQEKMKEMLNDEATYEKLKKDRSDQEIYGRTHQNSKFLGEGGEDHQRSVLVLVSHARKSTTDVWITKNP